MSLAVHILRPAEAADYAVVSTWLPDAAACLRWAGPRVPFPFAVQDLAALLAVETGHSYSLVDLSGMPRAFGQHWVLTAGSVHLGRLIVAPEARGQGVGRALVEQLIERAIAMTHATAVTLRVYRDNATAHALYTSLGFQASEAESTPEALFMRRA